MQASPGFLKLAPKLVRDIHANRLNGHSALGILGQSMYDTYGPEWISFYGGIKNYIWARTCGIYGLNSRGVGPDTSENENFLATYLLVLGEMCNIDIDTILQTEDLKNANPEAGSI